MKLFFKDILLILTSSLLIAFVYNLINPNGLQLIRSERELIWESDSLDSNENINSESSGQSISVVNDSITALTYSISSDKNFTEPKAIKIDFAYKLFKDGVKFIDARPVEEYNEGHIQNAVNIPFYESDNYEQVLSAISKDELLVTYCGGHDCDLSIMLGDELFNKGYKKVYIFYGGWNDWVENNYPIEKNK